MLLITAKKMPVDRMNSFELPDVSLDISNKGEMIAHTKMPTAIAAIQ